MCACGKINGIQTDTADTKSDKIESLSEKGTEYTTIKSTSDKNTASVTTTSHSDNNKPEAEPDANDYADFNDPYGLNIRNITYDTPGDAGVNLRKEPNSTSELIIVIPEGTEVRVLNSDKDTKDYRKIAVEIDGKIYAGFVMQRYLTTFTGAAFDSRICYNTPDHAGVVLRKDGTYYSDSIMIVPEGTQVRVIQIPNENGYIPVDIFYKGEIFSGYVLEKYVESIN